MRTTSLDRFGVPVARDATPGGTGDVGVGQCLVQQFSQSGAVRVPEMRMAPLTDLPIDAARLPDNATNLVDLGVLGPADASTGASYEFN